jgi:predicted glutamine amidotransferase
MCVAILQKAGTELTPSQLFQGWSSNPHGGGFAYVNPNNEVEIKQGYLHYNVFEKAYREAVRLHGKNGPMLVHMRIRSAGDMGAKNCHPFKIKGGAMIHNGTMFYPSTDRAQSKSRDRKSDTRIFAETFHNILDLESMQHAENDILNAVGRSNKLVFLYDGGDYIILNEKQGMWRDDIWFSNSSCQISAYHPSQRNVRD